MSRSLSRCITKPKRLRLQVEYMPKIPDVSVCSSLVRLFPRDETGEGFLKYEEWLMPRHKSVIVWGAGMTGRRLSKRLVREGFNIEFAVDIDLKKAGKTMQGIPIHPPEKLKDHPELFVISVVSSQQSRDRFREYLQELGRKETQDFICAA